MRCSLVALLIWNIGCRSGYLGQAWHIGEEDWALTARTLDRQSRIDIDSIAIPSKPHWIFETGSGVSAQPLVVDSTVIVSTLKGVVFFLSVNTGKELKSIDLGKSIVSSPAVSDSMMFVGLADGKEQLAAIDLLRGRVTWRTSTGPMDASPVLLDSLLVIATLDGCVWGINASDGSERWKFQRKNSRELKAFRATPAVQDSLVFIPSDDGNLYALSIRDGALRWSATVGGSLLVSPLVLREKIVAASMTGNVACFTSSTGEVLWRSSVGGPVFSALATDGRRIFTSTAARDVRALDAASGREAWRFAGSGPMTAAVAMSDAMLVGSLERSLISLSTANGAERWRMRAEARIRVAPVICRDLLIVVTDDRRITAYKVTQ